VSDAKVFIGDQVVVTVVSNVGRGFVYEANVSRDAFHTCRHDDEGVSLCGLPLDVDGPASAADAECAVCIGLEAMLDNDGANWKRTAVTA
jgi:hypothetical protein